jgi:uncharacterized protein (TIGR00661 family)
LSYESVKDLSIINYPEPNKLSEPVKINKRILVAPLDWGLGHATRCIPVIRTLLQSGCEVWIATSGPQEQLLQAEFPELNFLHLPGYGVSYGKRSVMLRLLRQIPVIRRHIWTEHAWLQTNIREHGFDGVISDNRYGLYSNLVPCVLITHQLELQLPKWANLFKNGVQQMLNHHIENFSTCWIPDVGVKEHSLAGAMSHPKHLPEIPTKYIGWLSRFEPIKIKPAKRAGILISISGPEPQRQMFEEKVLQGVGAIDEKIWLVRGLPGQTTLPDVPEHVTIYNHLPAAAFQALMLQCRLLISRSGYSTLMDAIALATPLACVPTPGQTEQEYLSNRLAEKGWSVSMEQEDFNLETLIGKAEGIREMVVDGITRAGLENVIGDWVRRL